MGKLLGWKKVTDLRYTYKYEKNKRAYQRHFSSLNDAVERAVDDLQKQVAIPICISCGGKMVLEPEDIHDAWSSKYLEDPPEGQTATKNPTF